jgi:hypothetical protein
MFPHRTQSQKIARVRKNEIAKPAAPCHKRGTARRLDMSEPQGPNSAEFCAQEDRDIAIDKAEEAWCDQWLSHVKEVAEWIEACMKSAPAGVWAGDCFDDTLSLIDKGAWDYEDETGFDPIDAAFKVIYDHAPTFKAFCLGGEA